MVSQPGNTGKQVDLTPIQQQKLNKIRELVKKRIGPEKDDDCRQKTLEMFKQELSVITGTEKEQLDDTTVQYNRDLLLG